MEYRDHMKAGGVVVRFVAGLPEVLVISRAKMNDWALPKGHVEAGETVEDAAVREVREETGYATKIVQKLGLDEYSYSFEDEPGIVHDAHVTFFLMELTHPDQGEIIDTYEVTEAKFLPAEEALAILSHDGQTEMARKGVKKANG